MRTRFGLSGPVYSAGAIGGSGGGRPVVLIVLVIVVLVMAGASLYQTVIRGGSQTTSAKDKARPYVCTTCGHVEHYTSEQLRDMGVFRDLATEANPPKLECPKCKTATMEAAWTCPNCGEVFVPHIDPDTGKLNDICPKCGRSWRELIKAQRGGGKRR